MDIPAYEVTLLLLTDAGAAPITLGADQVLVNPTGLEAAIAQLPAGDSLLYVNPLPTLSLTVSHLSDAERASRAVKAPEASPDPATPPGGLSDDLAPNAPPTPEGV
jgi:hypothetical protein